MESIPLKIRNEGGSAGQHTLRLGDVGEMYSGLHRTISYIILTLGSGELENRARDTSPVQLYQRQTIPGSVIHDLLIELSKLDESTIWTGLAIGEVVHGVAVDYVKDFVKLCFEAVTGQIDEKEQDARRKVFTRVEPHFEQLIETIEPHVKAVHAPISEGETIEINLGGRQILLNAVTKDYVSETHTEPKIEEFLGHVSRLNLRTGNGRFYVNKLDRVLPFSQGRDFQASQASKRLSLSLRRRDRGVVADIIVKARRIVTNSGRFKRLRILGTALAPE